MPFVCGIIAEGWCDRQVGSGWGGRAHRCGSDGYADKLFGGYDGLVHLGHTEHLFDAKAVVQHEGFLHDLVGADVTFGVVEVVRDNQDRHGEADEDEGEQNQRGGLATGKDPLGQRNANAHALQPSRDEAMGACDLRVVCACMQW